jgi:hypothetical protein
LNYRARPPRPPRPLSAHARLQVPPVGSPVLSRPRRAPQLPSPPNPPQPTPPRRPPQTALPSPDRDRAGHPGGGLTNAAARSSALAILAGTSADITAADHLGHLDVVRRVALVDRGDPRHRRWSHGDGLRARLARASEHAAEGRQGHARAEADGPVLVHDLAPAPRLGLTSSHPRPPAKRWRPRASPRCRPAKSARSRARSPGSG